MKLTAQNLVRAIQGLPKNTQFNYADDSNSGLIVIEHVVDPEGPIKFRRYDPTKDKTLAQARVETISAEMIWRLANAISNGSPVNVDTVFGGSYNTRSVLEALVASTPEFYMCRPGRIDRMHDVAKEVPGHKCLIHVPDVPHINGKIEWRDVDIDIATVSYQVAYGGLEIVKPNQNNTITLDRRHAQIQIALLKIGYQLGFRTWVASNDHSIKYDGQRLVQMDGVIPRLADEKVLFAYKDAQAAAKLIDCVWFKNGRLMPAVMEIEHSTGVTSGLTRMKKLYDTAPPLRDIRWTIVAPDSLRSKVVSEANHEQFKPLDARFFSYSAVDELFSLCERRKPTGITEEFLDCFMERCVS